MEGLAMQKTFRFVITAIVGTGLLSAQAPRTAEVELKAAQQKADVEGDLNGAIKQYAAIVAKYKSDRAVIAMALVHMAECYQKMGDAESRKIYEQVVKEYADQREAVAMARAHLGGGKTPANTIATRRVWTAPAKADFYGKVSPDGHSVVYTDWDEKGNLFLHDLVTGATRRVTDTADDISGGSGEYGEENAFSRDGRQLAYTWSLGKKGGIELRVVDLQAAGIPRPRPLVANPDLKWIEPCSWSPDGKAIAVAIQRKDRSGQIGIASVQDGSIRVLKSVEWEGLACPLFSPDGRYLAYDIAVPESAGLHEIFAIAADGSSESRALARPGHDSILGWSPDGKRLVFSSDRGGSMGIWDLAFAGGKFQGEPDMLPSNFGAARRSVLGMTSSGSLYSALWDPGAVQSEIRCAEFDFGSGKFIKNPVSVAQPAVLGNGLPSWSPDGRYLAFASMRDSYVAIGIYSAETGQVREIVPSPNFTPSFGYFRSLTWAPDGNSLIVGARGNKQGTGVYRVDAQTGHAALIASAGSPPYVAISPDGNTVYYSKKEIQTDETVIVKRDIASGQEKELLRRKAIGGFNAGVYLSSDGRYLAPIASDGVPGKAGTQLIIRTDGGSHREVGATGPAIFSPDGRYIAALVVDPVSKSGKVLLQETSGGETRDLVQVGAPAAWSPDSRFILTKKRAPDGDHIELWRVPIDGGPPQQLPVENADLIAAPVLVSSDGRHIAFMTPPSTVRKPAEVWVTENFLPAAR
jgi:Tol biopolymer transport system component